MTNVIKMIAATMGGIIGSACGALVFWALAPTQSAMWIAGAWMGGLVGIVSGLSALVFVGRLWSQRKLTPARDKAADHGFESRQPRVISSASPPPLEPVRAGATPLPIEPVRAAPLPPNQRVATPSALQSKPATVKRGKRARSSQPAKPVTPKGGKRARSSQPVGPALAPEVETKIAQSQEPGAAPPAKPAKPGTPARPPAPDPVAVFKIDGIAEGWMAHEVRRLSDMLNGRNSVRVRLPDRDGESEEWLVVDPETVVAVAPPPLSSSPLRLPRRQCRYLLRATPYRIAGTAHIPSDADPLQFLLSTPRHWLPLTNCTVERGEDAWEVEVVIVNLQHVRRSGLIS